jgi:hypothetical protein
VRAVPRDLLGLDDEIPGEIIEAAPAAFEVPQACQVAHAWSAAHLAGKAAVNGDRLRRILDAAHRRQLSARAQRIVACPMTAAHADDPARIPLQDAVEQAHGPAVRNQARDLRARHEHGLTATRR